MVDNVSVTPGTGASIAADEIGGVFYQRVKPVYGTDGFATDVSDTNALPVRGPGVRYTDVTLTLDTSAYASGDVLADTQIVNSPFRGNDLGGVLVSLTVIDKDDQKAAFDVYFLDQNVTMGTENAAPSISDTNATAIMGPPIAIGTGDYKDLGGVSIAGVDNIGKALRPASGTDDFYVAVVNGTGTPTYTVNGVVLRFGILPD